MSKTDIWMPLFIADYLADTQHLTRDEHGGYLLLLMAYWRNSGPLPDDDKRLAAIVKASPREWKTLRPALAEFFTIADGYWTHKRADKEIEEAAENARKNAERAKRAAEKRWGKQSSGDAPSIPPSNATSIPPSNPEGVLGQCPSPSPSPSNTGVVERGSNSTTPPPPADAGRSQVDPAFEPDEPNLRTAISLNLDATTEAQRFIAYYTATGDWRANWQAQFRKWLLDSMQRRADLQKRTTGKQGAREQYHADAAEAGQRYNLDQGEPNGQPAERDITGESARVA